MKFFFTPFILYSILTLFGYSISPSEKSLLQKCEKWALKVGSTIADEFNALIEEDMDSDARMNQDFVAFNLGFAPWMSKGTESSGRTIENSVAKDLQTKGGWIGKALRESPYNVLRGKWIYFYGDSTLRQIWATFAAPFQGICYFMYYHIHRS